MDVREHGLNEEQALLVRTVAEFAKAEISPIAGEMDEHPQKNDILKIMEKAAELGMLAAVLPAELGGEGLDLYSFLLAVGEMARESAAVAALALSHNLASKALQLAGLELPESISSKADLACLGLPARIEPGEAGNVVSGGCDFVVGLPLAGRVVLVGGEDEVVSLALKEEAGITSEFDHGLRAARPGVLEVVEAPVEQHGKLDRDALDYLNSSLYLGVAAISVGIAAKGFEVARAYANERYQAGDLIIRHQQLRLMLGGIRAVAEAGLSLLAGACGSDGDHPHLPTAMAAKALLCERAFEAACDAVQLHGGYGYMREYGMERLMRDASYCRVWPCSGQEALLALVED